MGIYFTLPDTAWQVLPDPYHWGQEVLSITRCLLTRFCLEREKVHISKEKKIKLRPLRAAVHEPLATTTKSCHWQISCTVVMWLPQATDRRCSLNVARTGH